MKLFILTTILAPYRIDYFNELGKLCELTVCFETKTDQCRDDSWYKKEFSNFKAVILKDWDKPGLKLKTDIIKHLREADYDIAVAFEYSTPTALLFMLYNIMIRKPYCINLDGGFISSGRLKSTIKRYFITRAAACLASGKMATSYFKYYGAKSEQIYYHGFTSLIRKDILDYPISHANKMLIKSNLNIHPKKTAIAVGQFIHRKGFDILINAWRVVELDCSLLIIGGGEKKEEYLKLITNTGIKNIELIGFKTKEELIEYYLASDLFILPTREDIWGLVINEAMACGLPVITTDKCIAGLELIKDYENGFIVPVERTDILAHRIEEVLSNNQLAFKMGEKNLQKIKSYTIENMARQHFEIFSALKVKNIIT